MKTAVFRFSLDDGKAGFVLEMTRAEYERVVLRLVSSDDSATKEFGSSMRSIFQQDRLYGKGFAVGIGHA